MDDLICPNRDGKTASATTAGTAVTIADLTSSGRADEVLYVWNRGTDTIRIKFGADATSLSFPLAQGAMQGYRIGAYTTIGLWCAVGTQPVELHRGDGL